MRNKALFILAGLFFLFPICGASADDAAPAYFSFPQGEILARAYPPSLPAGETAGLPEEEVLEEETESEDTGPFQFNMKFGDSWLRKAFSYKPFPPVEDYNELSGYKARMDYYRCGAVESKWTPVNYAMDFVADYFAGSVLLMQREYFVNLSILYGDRAAQY